MCGRAFNYGASPTASEGMAKTAQPQELTKAIVNVNSCFAYKAMNIGIPRSL